MNDPSLLLFIAMVALAIGFLSGMLVASARPRPGKDAVERAEREPAASADRVEVARLWRDRRRGTLLPQLDGRLFRTPYEMKAEQRERLKRIQADLSLWFGSSAAAAPTALPGKETGVQSPSLEILDVISSAIRPGAGKTVSQGHSANAASALTAIPQAVAAKDAPQSLATQIDAILQEKLESSPLRGRSIRLEEAPGRGVVVWVGPEQYEGVEAVPDPEVKELIRASVREWEAQNI